MSAPAKSPRTAAIFKSNRNQAVRIPKDLEFPGELKKVYIRKVGKALVMVPADDFWDDFFDRGPNLDFPERFPQGEYEIREEF